jgi:hypothetical protein
MALTLATLIGATSLSVVPAVAQERSRDSYSVADYPRGDGDRERESRVRIPPGTDIAVELDENVPIERDRFGETFEAHVKRDVIVKGEVAIPAGAPAKVKLVESSEKQNSATLRLTDVEVAGEMRDVVVSDARADTDAKDLSTGKKTAVGAVAGAVVGAVTGAGVLEGAVVGAGGGLAWGLLSDGDRKIDDGTTVQFELEEELETR